MTTKTSSKTILIDCQLFQNPTFNRGMGRYSRKLLEVYFKKYSKTFKKVVFIFNANKELDKHREAVLRQVHKSAEFVFLDFPEYDRYKDDTKFHLILNQEVLDTYIEKNFNKQDLNYLILSNFESGYSLSAFPSSESVSKSLIIYDLIPHLFSELYLQDETILKDYYTLYTNLFLADQIFCISKTSEDDLIRFLGFHSNKVANIDGALIDKVVTEKISSNFPQKIARLTPFFVSVSGDDLRKNNDNMIRGFAQFTKKNTKYSLLITSEFSEYSKEKLFKIRDEINPKAQIEFLGRVSDGELDYLYEKSSGLVFTPLYEGLGLPILEAVSFNKKIIASNIPVFKEISSDAFYYCDPYNADSIAIQLEKSIKDPEIKQTPDNYNKIAAKYTWTNTAKKFNNHLLQKKTTKIKKKKIAIMGPNMLGYSAIAKYIEEIFPSLLNYFEIDYYSDPGDSKKIFRKSYLPYIVNYYDAHELNLINYKDYDAVVYNIACNIFSAVTIARSQVLPGINILHEIKLKGIYDYLLHTHSLSKEKYQIEKEVDKESFIYPVINSGIGNITHSEYAKKLVTQYSDYTIPIKKIDLAGTDFDYHIEEKETDQITIGLPGILSKSKGLEEFLELASSLKTKAKIKYKIFGYDFSNESAFVRKKLKNIDCHFTTNLSEYNYHKELSSLDVLIAYKRDYHGETSKTCIDAMKYGVVPIVRNVGWYSELPDDAAIKVNSFKEISGVIEKLIKSKQEIHQRKLKVKSLLKDRFSPEIYAKELYDFIDKAVKTKSPSQRLSEVIKKGVVNVDQAGLEHIYTTKKD